MARGRKPKSKRPMRYPNGYGTVYQLSQPERRRHPWVVKIPKEWKIVMKDGEKKAILEYEVLSYCDSWEEGNEILVEYNRKKALGIEIIKDNITFEEVYKLALPRKLVDASEDTIRSYEAGYKHCKTLYNIPVKDIKTANMQVIIDKLRSEGKSTSTLTTVKKVCNTVFEYAIQNDLTDKQYASFIQMGKRTKQKDKHIFTPHEINTLFANDDKQWVDVILIMIYTGVRINELLKIKIENVYLENRYLITGSKTDAGKNRIIPISKKILPYISKRYNKDQCWLIRQDDGKAFEKNNFRSSYFNPTMEALNMHHTPHECRHTCASLMDAAGVNRVSQQLILGHKGANITEQVYIHKNLEELIKAIDLI